MSQPKIQTLAALKERVNQARTKAAAAPEPAPDPTMRDGKIPDALPEGTDNKQLGTPGGSATNPTEIAAQPVDAPPMPETSPSGLGGKSPSCSATVVQESAQKAAGLIERLRSLTPAAKAAATPAAAAAPAVQATDDEVNKAATIALAQIGLALLADQEGRDMVQAHIIKQAGQAKAIELMQDAANAEQFYAAVGAAEQEKQAAAIATQKQVAKALEHATPEQRTIFHKMAHIYNQESQHFADVTDDFWFQKGAGAMDAALAGGGAAGGPPPEGEVPPMPGGDGSVAPEDIIMLVQQMLESGEITEEQAMQILQEAGVELPGGAAGGGAPPPEEAAAMGEAAKAASVLFTKLGLSQ